MSNHHITRIREQYETDIANAEHARAMALAQLSAAGTPQKDLITGTGYSRETIRKLVGDGRAILAAQPKKCGHPCPDDPGRFCTDVPYHRGVHEDLRRWWINETDTTGANCATERCRLHDGHPGDHVLSPEPAPIEDVDVPF